MTADLRSVTLQCHQLLITWQIETVASRLRVMGFCSTGQEAYLTEWEGLKAMYHHYAQNMAVAFPHVKRATVEQAAAAAAEGLDGCACVSLPGGPQSRSLGPRLQTAAAILAAELAGIRAKDLL